MSSTKFDRIKCGRFTVLDWHHTPPSHPFPTSPCRLVVSSDDGHSTVIGTPNDIEEAEQLIAAIQAWIAWVKEAKK